MQRWFLLRIFNVNLFYHKLHQVVMVEISCWLVCRHHLKAKECFCWTEMHRGPLAFLTSRSVITPIQLAQQEFHSKSIKMFYLYCTCCVCRTALRWHSFPLHSGKFCLPILHFLQKYAKILQFSKWDSGEKIIINDWA